jgi:shikimate dehydrogenase
MTAITGRTRVVCVIGDPIAHSLSPVMHNAAFRHLGLDFTYVAFHVLPAQLKAAVSGMRALQIAGTNVTVPHKEKILGLLDAVSSVARRTGAVNTVANRGGKLLGENTDVPGFVHALEEQNFRFQGARVVVIGAGGAARAVLAGLGAAGAAEVLLLNRTAARARRLARLFATKTMPIETTPFPDLSLLDLGDTNLVVNTTSLGLKDESFCAVPYASTPKDCVFFDLIPRPATDFLRRAAAHRRPTLDGTSMLLHQGTASFEMWTGHAAPKAVMRRALRACIRQP